MFPRIIFNGTNQRNTLDSCISPDINLSLFIVWFTTRHTHCLGQAGNMAHLLASQALKQDSFTLSFFATHLQAKILSNMACVRNSGQGCSDHILLCTIFTLVQPRLTLSSTSAAYIMKCQKLQFLSTTRGPKSTLCGMHEVFPTKPSRELAKSHRKAEFDPRTLQIHTHTHNRAQPCKICGKCSNLAPVPGQ